MDVYKIINKYYDPKSLAYHFLVDHSKAVAKKSLELAKKLKNLNLDLRFIEEAAMLHDIGIFLTDFPGIGCFGKNLYVCHGYLGRELLEKEGLLKHALVCERHIGTGLTVEDIERQKIPIPKRDMTPVSVEEKLVAFADNFFSKIRKDLFEEIEVSEIRKILSKFGEYKVEKFDEWLNFFGHL